MQVQCLLSYADISGAQRNNKVHLTIYYSRYKCAQLKSNLRINIHTKTSRNYLKQYWLITQWQKHNRQIISENVQWWILWNESMYYDKVQGQ